MLEMSPHPKKELGGAVSVHTAIGSNVKRQWVAACVKKICLKCQHFRFTISSNYSKNWGEISSKIFSLKIDYYLYMIIFLTITWNFWFHSCS